MWGRTFIVGSFVALLITTPAHAQEAREWAQASWDFQKYKVSKDPTERARAAEGIGRATSAKFDNQAAHFLSDLLSLELGRNREGSGKDEENISGLVLEAIEEALKKVLGRSDSSKEALNHIENIAKNRAQHPRVRFYCCRALGHSTERAKELLPLVDDKDVKVQIGAIDGLVTAKEPAAVPIFLKVLNSTDRTWECKWSALQGLDRIGDKSDKVVDGLIDALGKCQMDEGRIKVEIMRILGHWLEIKEPKSDDPNWWRAAKADKNAPIKEGQTTIEPTEFFGLKAKSSRIVFVLDRTGSMSDPCTFPETPKKAPPSQPTQEANGKKLDLQEEGARRKAEEIKKKYDEEKVVSKMDGLKKEFIGTIFSLDQRVSFTVVLYEGNPKLWKNEMVPATWQNKLDCIQEMDKLQPSGPTNVFGGLEEAFKLMEQPNRPNVIALDKKGNYATIVNGPDTIFLMTDGNHNTGKFVSKKGDPGPDVDGFIAELKKINALRKLIINVVALGDIGVGGDPLTQNSLGFLKKIADETGGNFAHIGK